MEAALSSLAGAVTTSESLPAPEQLATADALVVAARTPAAAGFSAGEIASALKRAGRADLPLLWLTGQPPEPAVRFGEAAPRTYPVPLADLVAFLDRAGSVTPAAVAAAA